MVKYNKINDPKFTGEEMNFKNSFFAVTCCILFFFYFLEPAYSSLIERKCNKKDLEQNHIDLAIRFSSESQDSNNEGLVYEYFGEDDVYPVCSAKLAQDMTFTTPQDILKTWLVRLEQPVPFNWESWFENAGVKNYQEHEQWTEVVSTDIALSAVLSGHGFTLAAEYLFSQYLEMGALVGPIKIKHPLSVKRYLVFDANSAKRARLDIFMSWLKKEMNGE